MPKISQKIESKSNFKLWKIFHARINMTFESQNVILYVPRMFFIRCGWYRHEHMFEMITCLYVHKPMYTCMESIVGSRKRNRFSRGAIFLFYKAPRRNRYVPPKTGPFFQMVKISLFFSRYRTNIRTCS